MKRVPESNWEWYGEAGHFICGRDCRFHLCTKIGNYVISTVGKYWPSRSSREIHASVHDPKWLAENKSLLGAYFDAAYMKRFGFEQIGFDRTYETMVFRASGKCEAKECNCGLPTIDPTELDFLGYNDAKSAREGHMKLCRKWSREA